MLGLTLNNRQPIHEQLTQRITELVLSGVLEPDSPLPSVRELASELGVNPNTIQRAYGELDRVGVTYSVTGKGRFVTGDVEAVRNAKKREEMALLAAKAKDVIALGVTKEEIIGEIERIFEEGSAK